ncbi:MAG: hypothetical protein J6K16_03765 [Alphaproteobacteria bacterium]|nr:hypothetical protein [Alphaproteobacteria bacterium]
MDNIFNISGFINFIVSKIKAAFVYTAEYVSSLTNAELAMVSLFLIFIISALLAILFWYIKTITSNIQEARKKERELMLAQDTRLDRKVLNVIEDEYIPIKQEEVIKSPKYEQITKGLAKKHTTIDFDWNRNTRFQDAENIKSADAFQYRQKPQKLIDLLGLIVDLLERGVDEPKIAQTIMYKNQHLNSEDDIIQTITAIKFFIYLCVNNRFKKIDSEKMLPQESTAIFHIGRGDCSLALVLLETLIDNNLKKIKSMYVGPEKERKWCETSNCATIFGTLAAFTNTHLARGAFELAIELNPKNVTAWGRLGDMYAKSEIFDKAIWAYTNVLNLADEGIYTQQIANANKRLAIYYNETGWKEKADEMSEKSSDFYDKIKINLPLTDREVKIVKIIESKEFENMETIVDNFFNRKEPEQSAGYV